MADRWVTDKVTDTNSPFHLRRDVLDELEDEIESGGGTVVTFSFSQPGEAIVGTSGAWRVPQKQHTLVYVTMGVNTAPIGSPLTVLLKLNGTTIATLTILAGSTADYESVLDQIVNPGDRITVVSTSVGSSSPATGVVVQVHYL
jgi:hypothetical protein